MTTRNDEHHSIESFVIRKEVEVSAPIDIAFQAV